MKIRLIPLLTLVLASSYTMAKGEKYNHFPSLPAPDITTAMCNLDAYNQKLSNIVMQPALSAEDMVKIHELTYTLENAVLRLNQSLKETAEALENVHLASESLDEQTIKNQGEKFLKSIDALLARVQC
ncbi:MAG: DUF6746 family protein [Aestuariibacter sp.]